VQYYLALFLLWLCYCQLTQNNHWEFGKKGPVFASVSQCIVHQCNGVMLIKA